MLFKKKVFVSYVIFNETGKAGYGNSIFENFYCKTIDDIIDIQKKLVEDCKKDHEEITGLNNQHLLHLI